jgi:hypothetical protein
MSLSKCRDPECLGAERITYLYCLIFDATRRLMSRAVMLIVLLSVVMLSVSILNVAMPSVVMLGVSAPCE